MKIFVGTLKGLFVLSRNGGSWEIAKPEFAGMMVYSVAKVGQRIWAAPFTEWTGTQLSFSDDDGDTWESVEKPPAFPEDTETALSKVWQIVGDENGQLFCGTEPAALFTSEDNGKNWNLCRGLWNHPHRAEWQPGYGGLGLHTILPISERTWVIAVSTGGVYRTEDAGENWTACNQKIVAPFLADRLPEFGQCVHKVAVYPGEPDRMLLQHHWGVYRSDDAGKTWENVGENKLPSDFGFACVMNAPDTAFIIPIKADGERFFPEEKMRVFKTTDGGEKWSALGNGLPQQDVFDSVLRDSFAADGERLVFGTTGGNAFLSEDNGDSWEQIAQYLPRITCVRIFKEND